MVVSVLIILSKQQGGAKNNPSKSVQLLIVSSDSGDVGCLCDSATDSRSVDLKEHSCDLVWFERSLSAKWKSSDGKKLATESI